jgi:hypothetical protein
MPAKKKKSKYVPLHSFIGDAHLLLANSLVPDILPHMVARGYTQPEIEARLAEVEAFRKQTSAKGIHEGERMAASQAMHQAKAALHPIYMEQLGIARIALKADHSAQVALELLPRRKRDYPGYIAQGSLFCNNLLANDEWLSAMAAMGVSTADVTSVRDGFEALRQLVQTLSLKEGEVMQYTQDRNAAYKALKEWVADFRKVARIALRPYPQACEQLGIKQKS